MTIWMHPWKVKRPYQVKPTWQSSELLGVGCKIKQSASGEALVPCVRSMVACVSQGWTDIETYICLLNRVFCIVFPDPVWKDKSFLPFLADTILIFNPACSCNLACYNRSWSSTLCILGWAPLIKAQWCIPMLVVS